MTAFSRLRGELLRTNFAGREVSLLEGAGVVLFATGVLALRGRTSSAAMIGGIGALGLLDDLVEPHRRRQEGAAPAKGLRGHLGALRRGEVTTGGVKAVGIPLVALAATAPSRGASPLLLLDAALVAGASNLVNLLDLRPGRALKAVLPTAALLAAAGGSDTEGRDLAATAVLVGVAALPADLAERGMLGDAGANALGAAVGASAAHLLPVPARILALTTIIALTLASEKVSFSAVIRANPVLSALDDLGRRTTSPEGSA